MPDARIHTPPQLPTRYDAGLLVVHGVGDHAPTSTLESIAEPLLARMRAEGSLQNAVTLELGSRAEDGGPFKALHVRYRTKPGPGGDRSLLVVEGVWSGLYRRASAREVSAWLYALQRPMLWAVTRYYARDVARHLVPAWVVLGFFALAAFALHQGETTLAVALVVLAFAIGLIKAFVFDAREIWRAPEKKKRGDRARAVLIALPASAVFFVYQIQRGVATLLVPLGILLLYVVMPLIRALASIPFLDRFGWWLFGKIETALLTGGVADMEAVANDHVSAAAVRARLRAALIELETAVRPGGSITVVAHSGGTVPAWRLLSEPEIVERVSRRNQRHRYRLITVGAALNFAREQFHKRDSTPLDAPLVTSGGQQTCWLNVYGAWDPVPHGPVRLDRWPQPYASWDGVNRMVRNLGAPVPDEHGEYWRNQEEFVPLVARAIDPELPWLDQAVKGKRPRQWTLTRLGMLSAIVRVRFTLVAASVTAFALFLAGFVRGSSNMFDYVVGRLTSWFEIPALSRACLEGAAACSADPDSTFQRVLRTLHSEDWLANAAGLALLLFLSYVLMNVYTNLFWGPLARGPLPFARVVEEGGADWSFPGRDVARLELPTLLLLLAPIAVGLRDAAFWIVLVAGAVLVVLEVVWLWLCCRALACDAEGAFAGFAMQAGRACDYLDEPWEPRRAEATP